MPSTLNSKCTRTRRRFQVGPEWVFVARKNKSDPLCRQLVQECPLGDLSVDVFNFRFLHFVFSRWAVFLQAPPAGRTSKHNRLIFARLAIKQSWGILRAGHCLYKHQCSEIWLKREGVFWFSPRPPSVVMFSPPNLEERKKNKYCLHRLLN